MTNEQIAALKNFKQAVKCAEKETDIVGAQFGSLKAYKNAHGEVANYDLNFGIDHSKVVAKDLQKYIKGRGNQTILAHLVQRYGLDIVTKAFDEKIKSAMTCLDGTNVHSNAQKDAYLPITKGIKYCIATNTIMLHAHLMRKTTIIPGVYPKTNKRKLTLCKDEIDKLCNTKSGTKRVFKIELKSINTLNIAGKTINFSF